MPQTVNEENKGARLEIFRVLRRRAPWTCQNLVLKLSPMTCVAKKTCGRELNKVVEGNLP